MKSIAMFNNKGGVGKTTLVCNLASFIAKKHNKKVLVIDADPQCNSTVNFLDEEVFDSFYYERTGFTIYDILQPLHRGTGYSEEVRFYQVTNYGVDFLIGDPRLSLMEDLLSNDWKDVASGEPRGLRTNLVFSQLLSRCHQYDYVFFDMGPSLGSLNRSILLACDFFLTPLSIDIFSLLALENIGQTLMKWKRKFEQGIENNTDPEALAGLNTKFNLQFVGYVTQQYTPKKMADGVKRAVKAYDRILQQIPEKVHVNLIETINNGKTQVDYNIGSIPNFNSVIPMSQTARKPVFALESSDGVVGSHFTKVKEFEEIIAGISGKLVANIEVLKHD